MWRVAPPRDKLSLAQNDEQCPFDCRVSSRRLPLPGRRTEMVRLQICLPPLTRPIEATNDIIALAHARDTAHCWVDVELDGHTAGWTNTWVHNWEDRLLGGHIAGWMHG